MAACRCSRSGQSSVCRVVTVPFELDVNVGHSARCHSSNSMRMSSSCANLQNLLQGRYEPCSKFMVVTAQNKFTIKISFPGLRMERRCWRMMQQETSDIQN
jgi:hypothetical protein